MNGQIIKAARKAKGLSLEKLVHQLVERGIRTTGESIRQIEEGYTDCHQFVTLWHVCRVLGINPEELVAKTENMPKNDITKQNITE